jgi:hypothetical protein
MIDASFGVGPRTEALRQQLMIPFSLVICPGDPRDIAVSPVSCDQYPRCSHCGADFSSLSVRDATCLTKPTAGAVPEDLGATPDFEIPVNEPVGVEVTVLYVSVNFHADDLDVIKPAVLAFLKSYLDERPLIVMLGHPVAAVAILCPHVACYSSVDGMAVRTCSEIEFDELPSPILLTDDAAGLDLSRFIFAPEQAKGVAATLQRVSAVGGGVPFDRVLANAALVSNGLPLSPVHVIAVVPRVGSVADRLRAFHSALVRIDLLTPVFDDFAGRRPGRCWSSTDTTC